MKRNALIGTIAAAVLAVGGIGVGVGASIAATQDSADPTPSATVSETPTAEPAVEPEATSPLVAETSAPDADEADARFLEYVRGELLPDTGIRDASDEQLIAAGHRGCEMVKAGVPLEEIRLVEGEEPAISGYYMDTSAIFSGAQSVYCPETIVKLD